MRAVAGTAREAPVAAGLAAGLAAIGAVAVVAPAVPVHVLVVAFAALAVAVAYHRQLLAWRAVLVLLALVILFIPIRRYTLPVDISHFELEPYRVVVAFILAGWTASLLVDPRVRLRRTGLEGPIALIAVATLGSIVLNLGEIAALDVSASVVKTVSFVASFFLVLYLIVSTLKPGDVDRVLKVLVGGGAIVGALALYESRSGYNVFDHLRSVMPFLEEHLAPNKEVDVNGFARGDRLRTYASAEHPIALAAALCMLVPPAIYLAVTSRRRLWWIAAGVLGLGVLATVSRTGVMMLLAAAIVFLWLRPRKTLRMWPALLPALVVVHFALPHTLGILKSSFLPEGGLIAEQRSSAGSKTAGGRVSDLDPVFAQVARNPIFGVGFGTQVIDVPGHQGPVNENARILDNQWLGTLLETGVLGVLGWAWLLARFVRRSGKAAKLDDSPRGWLLVALAASVASFAVGMLTYDAFAFIQVTFLLFILVGLGVATLRRGGAARALPGRA